MNKEYLRTSGHSYMIIREADFPFEEYELMMILHNDLNSILSMQVIAKNGASEYWYDVTGMRRLDRQMELEPLNRDAMTSLLNSLCALKHEMELFMLDDANIDYSSEMIFTDKLSCRIRFCYIPGGSSGDIGSIRSLFESVLQHLDHADCEAVRLGYGVYKICMEDGFSAETVYAMLSKSPPDSAEDPDCIAAFRPGRSQNSLPVDLPSDDKPLTYDHFLESDVNMSGDSRKKSLLRRFPSFVNDGLPFLRKGRTREKVPAPEIFPDTPRDLSDDSDQTVCFFDSPPRRDLELSYRGSGAEQNILIDRYPFLIGKDTARVDGVMKAPAVSRIHARITRRGDAIYLEDYNSTNGTYLNDRLLPMNTPTPVKRGDRITFAAEEYVLIDRISPEC